MAHRRPFRRGTYSFYQLSEKVKPVATLSLSEASDPYEAIVTRKREGGKYTGPENNPYKGTILDMAGNPQFYDLTPQQQKAISMIDGHQEYGRNYTNSQFIKDKKDQIHRSPVREGGAYLPTVDIGEDVVEYLGSDLCGCPPAGLRCLQGAAGRERGVPTGRRRQDAGAGATGDAPRPLRQDASPQETPRQTARVQEHPDQGAERGH